MRNFCIAIVTLLMFASCSDKMQCPAYSSYFMLDDQHREEFFAYFGEDSLPGSNLGEANKNQFGIIQEPKVFPYYFKNRELRTVPMEMVFSKPPDSLLMAGDIVMYAEMDVVDSALIEEQPANRWNWNVEQEYYFRRIKDLIVLPEDLEKADRPSGGPETSATAVPESEEKKGFFKRLFGKKDRTEEQSTEQVEDTETEESGEEKEGFFKRLFGKKNRSAEEEAPPPEQEPEPEEEDEGDGGF